MVFPQELIDLVVDNLEGDVFSLRSCSLGARTFATPSQRHLFRKVEIHPPHGIDDNPCQRFYETLIKSPHLADLVDDLLIVLINDETYIHYDENGHSEYRSASSQWLISDEVLSLILPLLKLRRIALVETSVQELDEQGRWSMHWTTLGGALKSALADVFSSPTLKAAHLRGMVIDSPKELLSLFSGSTSLKSLSLSRIHYDQVQGSREEWPEAKPWSPRLTSLLLDEMHGDTVVKLFLNPLIDLSHITSFRVASDREDNTRDIIAAVSSHNCVQNMAVWYMETPLIKTLFQPQLRSLHFFTLDMPQTISDIFSECPADSCLETVVVDGRVRHTRASLNDVVKAGMVRLPLLRRVELRAVHMEFPEEFPDWATHVCAALPALVERELLEISLLEGLRSRFLLTSGLNGQLMPNGFRIGSRLGLESKIVSYSIMC